MAYDGDFRLPLVLGQGSPIIHSSCEGELGVALQQKCHDLRQAGQTSALTGLWSDFWRDELSAANTAGMGAAGGGAGTSIQVMLASGQGRPSGHSFQFFYAAW